MTEPRRPRRPLGLGHSFWSWFLLSGGLGHRTYVYDLGDALEVEEHDTGFEITRRRVFFQDVVMVTHHRAVHWWVIIVCLLFGLMFGVPAVIIAVTEHVGAGLIMFSIISAPFLFITAWHAMLGVDVVRVQGVRGSAELRFHVFKSMARRLYRQLGERIGGYQQQLLGSQAAPEGSAPPPPEPSEPSAAP